PVLPAAGAGHCVLRLPAARDIRKEGAGMTMNGSSAPPPVEVAPPPRHRPPWPSGLQANGSLGLGVLAAIGLLVWVGVNGYKQTLLVTAATYALIALGMYIPFVLAGSL